MVPQNLGFVMRVIVLLGAVILTSWPALAEWSNIAIHQSAAHIARPTILRKMFSNYSGVQRMWKYFTALFSFLSMSLAQAQTAQSLPDVTFDCYQAFATAEALPEKNYAEVAIDGDNFDKPTVRYRLQVVEKKILKVIERPNDPAIRKEFPKNVFEMTRDFMNKHQIVGWREFTTGGTRLYTIDFDNRLFSILDVPKADVPVLVQLHVFKCNPIL
jgi:hypothetical protein